MRVPWSCKNGSRKNRVERHHWTFNVHWMWNLMEFDEAHEHFSCKSTDQRTTIKGAPLLDLLCAMVLRWKEVKWKEVNKMLVGLEIHSLSSVSDIVFLEILNMTQQTPTGIPPTSTSTMRENQPPPDNPDDQNTSNNTSEQVSDPNPHASTRIDVVEASPTAGLASNTDSQVPTKTKNGQKKGGKRGNPGVFLNHHLAFLEKSSAAYLSKQTHTEKTLWLVDFRQTWFEQFPWHLGQQPAEFAVLDTESTVESADGGSSGSAALSEEELSDLRQRRKLAMERVQADGLRVCVFIFLCLALFILIQLFSSN